MHCSVSRAVLRPRSLGAACVPRGPSRVLQARGPRAIQARPLSTHSGAAAPQLSSPLQWYRHTSVAAPLTTAFATCLLKGSASDLVAQVQVEKCERVDWRRNAAFALFSGAYLGIGQHAIYNVAFTRIFGTGTDLLTGLKKVIADSLVHVPLIYLPLYYPCVPRPPPPAPTPCS